MTARQRVIHAVRSGIAYALYYSGLLGVIQRSRLRGRAVVLMYHRVLTPAEWARSGSHPGMVVARDSFARHVEALSRHFDVLSLDQFAATLSSGRPFARPSCLITFDDGWRDNLDHALPLLRARNLPWTIFLPVHFIGARRLFLRETVTHLVATAIVRSRSDRDLRLRADTALAPLDLAALLDVPDADPRPAVIAALGRHRYASGPAFEALAETLGRDLGIDDASRETPDRFIGWDDVAQMQREGVAFGGHGVSHRVLTEVAPDVVEDEVKTSKRVLDERLGGARAFAYPNGAWNPAVVAAVRAAGYALAFTTDAGTVGPADDPYTLRRISIHDGLTGSTPMFLARVAGIF